MTWQDYKQIITLPEKQKDLFVLGIDLGTTNSCISYWDFATGRPAVIDTSGGFGKAPMPSAAQYREDEDEWIIGDEAFRSYKLYPETTVLSVKRLMGTDKRITISGKTITPEEISGKILSQLVSHVYALNPNAEIAGAVVSVPYDFTDSAKKATLRAASTAGLGDALICLTEEPKAAALTYNFKTPLKDKEKILVFDFGGGTLDITVFEVRFEGRVQIVLEVISDGGEADHGGDAADEALYNHFLGLIETKTGQAAADIPPQNAAQLYLTARETKERLSGVSAYRVPFSFCVPPFMQNITRPDFEELLSAFITKTRRLVQKTLQNAYNGAIKPHEISRVLLEGGSCMMPWVKQTLTEIVGDAAKIYASDAPALDISIGAAYYAAMKMGLVISREVDTADARPARAVSFEAALAHDIGFEIVSNNKPAFYSMLARGTLYRLAQREKVFTLNGDTPRDMTRFTLKVLERIDKADDITACRLIGEVIVDNLPERPPGKTRLAITLSASEEGGLITTEVEDLGFGNEFMPSGFKRQYLEFGSYTHERKYPQY